jgi:hypothetical protein
MKYSIELIEWHDAHADDTEGWVTGADLTDSDYLVRSVGYVVKETANNVTLAMDVGDEDYTNSRARVPKGMIIKRTVLWKPDGS